MEENQIKPTIDSSVLTGIRFRIWGLLNVYPELSFTELAKRLGKSKSTIHPHLQKLIELGIVEISKREHVRANIEAHYYSLTPDANEKLLVAGYDLSQGIDMEFVQKVAKSNKSVAIYNRNILDKYIKFCEYVEETDSDDIVEICKDIYKTVNLTKLDISHFFMGEFFLTENQWKRWQKLFYKLALEFEEQCIKEQKENPNQEKYIYFFNTGIPVKILFEEMELKKFTNKK
ncbi:MAG: winged helix-turn-helix transcriptional regulator [Candidatus Lokiarchaeota archaeon]|nr:winged helix-turn-helix transcriptional regulator [Candidatus Lokiarchaeota archaeon]